MRRLKPVGDFLPPAPSVFLSHFLRLSNGELARRRKKGRLKAPNATARRKLARIDLPRVSNGRGRVLMMTGVSSDSAIIISSSKSLVRLKLGTLRKKSSLT